MKLRIAKKVLADPDRYTGHQRLVAAHRLYTRASTFKDGEQGLLALYLKPQRSFHNDDQLDLRFEYLMNRYNKLEEIDFPPGEVVIDKEALRKPAFRKDGQVQNFNAMPFPTRYHYKHKVVAVPHERHVMGGDNGDATIMIINEGVLDELRKQKWEMGEWRVDRPDSRRKYQVREGNVAGKRRPRMIRDGVDFNNFGHKPPCPGIPCKCS
jgi:hypothetical protein